MTFVYSHWPPWWFVTRLNAGLLVFIGGLAVGKGVVHGEYSSMAIAVWAIAGLFFYAAKRGQDAELSKQEAKKADSLSPRRPE